MTHPPIRLIRPSLAWVVACAASGLAMMLSFGALTLFEGAPAQQDVLDYLGALIPASLLFGIYIALFTALPTLAVAWLMHARRWQAVWISTLLGAATGGIAVQFFNFPLQHGLEGLWMTGLFAGVGLVGGAVYRLVAGKR